MNDKFLVMSIVYVLWAMMNSHHVSFAQENVVLWTITPQLKGSSPKLVADNQGNIYIVQNDRFIDKFDKNGELIWSKDMGENIKVHDIAVDENYFYITGKINKNGLNDDIYVGKYNLFTGELVWHSSYDGPISLDDYGKSIAISNNNIYVCGNITYKFIFPMNVKMWKWLGKYDKERGNIIWIATSSPSGILSITVDKDENVYVASGGLHIYDKNGKLLSNKIIKGVFFKDICLDKEGNIYLIGSCKIQSFTFQDIWIGKYDNNLELLWSKVYTGTYTGPPNPNIPPILPTVDSGEGIVIDHQNNIYAIGFIENVKEWPPLDFSDIWLAKYSAAGEEIWVRTYDSLPNNAEEKDYDLGRDITVDISGNVYAAGSIRGEKLWLCKLGGYFDILTENLQKAILGRNYSLELLAEGGSPPYNWEITKGNLPKALSLAERGYIRGLPEELGKFSFSLKVQEKLGNFKIEDFVIEVKATQENVPSGSAKIKINTTKGYVNPYESEVYIILNTTKSGEVKVKIFDLKGKLIKELTKNIINIDEQNVLSWDCKDTEDRIVPSGIYIIKIKGCGIETIKKVAVAR